MLGGKRAKAPLKPYSYTSTFQRSASRLMAALWNCPCPCCSVLSLKYHFTYFFLHYLRRRSTPFFFSFPLPSPHGHFNLTHCAADREGCWQDAPVWGLWGVYFPGLVWAQICGYCVEDIHLRELCLCFPDQLRERISFFLPRCLAERFSF